MAESIIHQNISPTSRDSNTNKNCFMCQASVVYKINTCTIDIYALVGNIFQRHEFVHMVRKDAGVDVIFTPLGKAKITGVYCDNCKDACSKACLERIKKSKKRHKLALILSIVFLSLAVSAFPLMSFFQMVEDWFPWYILPGLVTLLSLYMIIATLDSRKRSIATIEKKFTVEAKLVKSDFFKEQLIAISSRIDVSGISYKFGAPSGDRIYTEEAKATKENNLLFVPDDNMLRESVLDECPPYNKYYTDATFGHFYAIDYCDDRYWYSITTISNLLGDFCLMGFNVDRTVWRLVTSYEALGSLKAHLTPDAADAANGDFACSQGDRPRR